MLEIIIFYFHFFTKTISFLPKIFDTEYCRACADRLWMGRMAWVQEQAARVPNGSRVLDAGAGTCPYRGNFTHCDYITQDLAETPGVSYGKIDILSDISSITEPNESFDVILCSEVFEHIPNPIDALKELSRLLKPGGTLIFTAPLGSGQHQMPYHYYGGYTRTWYEVFFPKFSLEIISIEPNGGLYGHLVEMLWRTNGLVGGIATRGIAGRLIASVMQVLIYNLPTIFFTELERRKLLEDFTTGFLCIAKKK